MDLQKHLEEELELDLKLLKALEDQRRSESDPKRKLGFEREIKDIKQRIYDRRTELRSVLAESQSSSPNSKNLVQEIRNQSYSKIQEQCGTLRIFDVARPIELDDLFVDVNILDRPSSYVRIDSSSLPIVFNLDKEEFDRAGLGKVQQERLQGQKVAEDNSKLMVLGKPGSGKSTFLQHLAIQCNRGQFHADLVPFFLRLKDFADQEGSKKNPSLLDYIHQELSIYESSDPLATNKLLNEGRFFLLLDGLDEIEEVYTDKVAQSLTSFFDRYHRNRFVLTCRTATTKYQFKKFVDVEVADFNQKQIENFARKWFIAVEKQSSDIAGAKAFQFIKTLNLPKNSQIRELAVTPILLILTCLVFQANSEFPFNRIALYEEGLEILLEKWDSVRGIQRDQIYRNLSPEQKLDLLIYVASITFENRRYFFKQDDVCNHIADYLRTILGNNGNSVSPIQDSKIVLKSIELQHGLLIERVKGIYSFSHLTFQEYLTARGYINKILDNRDTAQLERLFVQADQPNWKEVFSLLRGILLQNPNNLIKFLQMTRMLVMNENEIQQILIRIEEKSVEAQSVYKLEAVRAFYFGLTVSAWHGSSVHDFGLVAYLDPTLSVAINHDLEYYRKIYKRQIEPLLNLSLTLDLALTRARRGYYELLFTINLKGYLPSELAQDLQLLKKQKSEIDKQISKISCGEDSQAIQLEISNRFLQKWQNYFAVWLQKTESYFPHNQDLCHRINLTSAQKQLLQKYYNINLFIGTCLANFNGSKPKEVQQIENMIIMPSIETIS
jgi:energy-coupling factor transporter ATP-binding protein EcfA2